MKYHESMTFDDSSGYFEIIDTLDKYNNPPFWDDNDDKYVEPYEGFRRVIADKFNDKLFIGYPDGPFNDSIIMSETYMVDNINWSLYVWRNSIYAKNLGFKDFCEMILPYRAYKETFPKSKKTLHNMFKKILSVSNDNSLISIINRYKIYVKRCQWILKYADINSHSDFIDLYIPKFVGECQNAVAWTCNIFRACGIPCVMEYTPQWQDRPRAHFWCCVLDTDGILKPFTPPDNNLFEDWESNLQYAGKVYRINYGVNKDCPYFMANEHEKIPDNLSSLFISDETHRYHSTATISYPLIYKTTNNIGYLCFFDRNSKSGLNAIAWGKVNHKTNRIIFEKVPLNMIFFPAITSSDKTLLPIGQPFEIKTSNNNYLRNPHSVPMKSNINDPFIYISKNSIFDSKGNEYQDLKLCIYNPSNDRSSRMLVTRKNPLKRVLLKSHEKLVGSKWIACNSVDGKYDTIATLKYQPQPYLQDIELQKSVNYRFVKFITPDNGPVNIAHMEFISDKTIPFEEKPNLLPTLDYDGEKKKTSCTRLTGTPMKSGKNPHAAFDGNMETYVGSKYIGMDFGKPKEFSRIRFAPRNANNGIVRGDKYELYIYDMGWKLYDCKIASKEVLAFDNVPTNSIFWLKNISNGYEEHPFTYTPQYGQCFINKTE